MTTTTKGTWGGARKNAGGKREGAGRKAKPKQPTVKIAAEGMIEGGGDMLKLLQDIALGRIEASTTQVRAAIAAVQYTHTKRADGGKKEERAEKAKAVAGGKFSPAAPPRLVSNNR